MFKQVGGLSGCWTKNGTSKSYTSKKAHPRGWAVKFGNNLELNYLVALVESIFVGNTGLSTGGLSETSTSSISKIRFSFG